MKRDRFDIYKIKYALIVLSFVAVAVVVFFTTKKHVLYSDCIVSQAEFDEIVKTRAETGLHASPIWFNGQKLIYDDAQGTYYYSVMKSDSGGFNPQITYERKPGGLSLAILDGEISNELIARGEAIELLFYNGAEFGWLHLKITTLPVINICCKDTLEEADEKIAMNICVFDNSVSDVKEAVLKEKGKIRIGGHLTRNWPQKKYKMTLENKRSILGLGNSSKWDILPFFGDEDKVRGIFSNNLWYNGCSQDRCFGVINGSPMGLVEVFVNDKYYGMYSMISSDYRSMLEAGASSHEEFVFNTESWIDVKEVAALDNGQIPEGFSLETDTSSREKAYSILVDYFKTVEDEASDITDIERVSDIDNAIDLYLFLNLIQGVDQIDKSEVKNLYNLRLFAKYLARDDGYKILYSPRDYDRTWGEGFDQDLWYDVPADFNIEMSTGPVAALIRAGDENIIERIKERYLSLRANEWSDEAIFDMLDDYEVQIYDSGAYKRNYERWPECAHYDGNQRLSVFKEYVKARLKYMDEYVDGL